jgi:hypothetical protein
MAISFSLSPSVPLNPRRVPPLPRVSRLGYSTTNELYIEADDLVEVLVGARFDAPENICVNLCGAVEFRTEAVIGNVADRVRLLNLRARDWVASSSYSIAADFRIIISVAEIHVISMRYF